jgi:alpha-N-arabinofuranosidase
MTGLERNADLVVMTSYAPLFAHKDAWQWTPDLIWFDNLRVYGTPNYYVQKMFSLNRGDRLLSAEVEGLPSAESKKKTLIVSSCLDEKAGEVILKAVNMTGRMLEAAIELQGIDKIGSFGKAIILTAEKNTDENTFENPKKVHPVESSLSLSGSTFNYTFKPYSLTVLRIPMTK